MTFNNKFKKTSIQVMELSPPAGDYPLSSISKQYHPVADDELNTLIESARQRCYVHESHVPLLREVRRLTDGDDTKPQMLRLVCGPRIIALLEEVRVSRVAFRHLEEEAERKWIAKPAPPTPGSEAAVKAAMQALEEQMKLYADAQNGKFPAWPGDAEEEAPVKKKGKKASLRVHHDDDDDD